MGMSRREKRESRREVLRRATESKPLAPEVRKKGRASRTRVKLRRALLATTFAIVLMVMLVAKPNRAMAALQDAPEIDPGSMASAMTLLVGGVLSLTGRVRRA